MADANAAPPRHVPVLLREVVSFCPERADLIVDATLGLGGHAEALLEAHPESRLVAFDRDVQAIEFASTRLARFRERIDIRHEDFRSGVQSVAPYSVSYEVADLGVSSLQLDDPSRGFSFRHEAPLDMRMDPSGGRSASDILDTASERELERILTDFGEEPKARLIARSVVMERRQRGPWTTVRFANLVRRHAHGRPGIDPSTRAFQALRIATNDELDGLDRGLSKLAERLREGGRLAVIAFHSLEDRIVKMCFKGLKTQGDFTIVTPKPVEAGQEETRVNPRARSAKLRVIERRSSEAR